MTTRAAFLVAVLGCASPAEPIRDELELWFHNMGRHHRYDADEMALATGLTVPRALFYRDTYQAYPEKRPPPPPDRLVVLPYPGGRHPRIGFLEGAVEPHRDTKFSVFLPGDAGYVVVDFPEAVWSNRDLLYLAHRHIPTVWEKQGIPLDRMDWKRRPGDVLESRRVLPNGLAFSARVVPVRDGAEMELRLQNGSRAKLTGLRSQVCVLLKGAPDFKAQTRDNKVMLEKESVAAVKAKDGRRWVAAAWERGRTWDNPPCPCIHSDPSFPDLDPGQEAVARGRLFYWEGDDIVAEVARRSGEGSLFGPPPK